MHERSNAHVRLVEDLGRERFSRGLRHPENNRTAASSGRPHPLEAVEDQIEHELEVAHTVVARLRDVLLDVLGEVGVLLGGEVLEEAGCETSQGLWRCRPRNFPPRA